MSHDRSRLLGLERIVVESAQVHHDRIRTVHVGSAAGWVEMCPLCPIRSTQFWMNQPTPEPQ